MTEISMRAFMLAAALAVLGSPVAAQSPDDVDRLKRMLDQRIPPHGGSGGTTRSFSQPTPAPVQRERPLRSDDFYSIKRDQSRGAGPEKRSSIDVPALPGISAAWAADSNTAVA